MRTKLSVNVDHVATLRQARRTVYPDPVEVAHVAEEAGAVGITVHLRGDRRHIQESDVTALERSVAGKLNLEMAADDEMLEIALRERPDQVTLVPERPDELTTEGGLDLAARPDRVREVAERLRAADIAVSVFVDPDLEQIESLARFDDVVVGFEINTDAYTAAFPDDSDARLESIAAAADRGSELGFAVYAGHGLTRSNVGPVARIEPITELNIGHFLVSRAVSVGMAAAVEEMLAAMR